MNNDSTKGNGEALLSAFEKALLLAEHQPGLHTLPLTTEEYNAHPRNVKTRDTRLALVKYIITLEQKVETAESGIDRALEGNDLTPPTGKFYVALDMADPNGRGRTFSTWNECEAYVNGRPMMAYKRVASGAEAKCWFVAKTAKRDVEHDEQGEVEVVELVGIKPENIPSGADIRSQQVDDRPPWLS